MRIHYLFVDESVDATTVQHTIFHLLRESETSLLRSFMALLLYPAGVEGIVPEGKPFSEAVMRLHNVPSFREAGSEKLPPSVLWRDLSEFPLLVLLTGARLPLWLADVAEIRPVVLLSGSESAVEAAGKVDRVFAGLLRGMEDVREFYRTLRGLCRLLSQDHGLGGDARARLSILGERDLFTERSRLKFIPAFALPQPGDGRPAVYLLNRLSNNVDELGLQRSRVDGSEIFFPELLGTLTRAAEALALFEQGRTLPADIDCSNKDVESIHSTLVSQADDRTKFDTMLDLGRRIRNRRSDPLFVTAPAVRTDLLRGRIPEGAHPEPGRKQMLKPGLHAVTDFIEGSTKRRTGSVQETKAYDRFLETLLLEQRFLACQTAVLASRADTVPLQLPPLPGDAYNQIRDLNQALERNSRKSAGLFRGVEQTLADLLPMHVRQWLERGDSPVVLLSDLPFEWALLDQWPLCLTRAVSRIPLGITRWDVLSAVLESRVSINTRAPERVLVLDLISAHDPIRHFSDTFIAVSESNAQKYVYATPANATRFNDLFHKLQPDIVVVDTHGRYNRAKDEFWIRLPDGAVSVDQLLPYVRVPPVWILSACDTSVTGAMRGCFVRRLLAKGAVCVIATLARTDAFTASMFVGRLLTDIFNPVQRGWYRTLGEVIFATQSTTALLYDPLLPLIRNASQDAALRKALGNVLGEYFAWAAQNPMGIRQLRHAAAWAMGESMARHGLTAAYVDTLKAGNVKPETLLFSAFGVPSRIDLTE